MKLSPKLKCLVKLVRDKCDLCGVWHPNWIIAKAYIGEEVTEDELLGIDDGQQFEKLLSGKIFCSDFVTFQYGNLSEKSPVHRKVMGLLEQHKIGSKYPINTLKDKEEDKEEDKVTVKDKVKEYEPELIFPYFSEDFKLHWNILNEQKKWKRKPFSALQASLKKLSNYPEDIAINILADCIAGEWQGLVTDKYDKQITNGKPSKVDGYKKSFSNVLAKRGINPKDFEQPNVVDGERNIDSNV